MADTDHVLIRAASIAGYDVQSYCGRAGARDCVAITTHDTLPRVIVELTRAAIDMFTDGETEDLLIALGVTITDSMGRDKVYYWPSVLWPCDADKVRP